MRVFVWADFAEDAVAADGAHAAHDECGFGLEGGGEIGGGDAARLWDFRGEVEPAEEVEDVVCCHGFEAVEECAGPVLERAEHVLGRDEGCSS